MENACSRKAKERVTSLFYSRGGEVGGGGGDEVAGFIFLFRGVSGF